MFKLFACIRKEYLNLSRDKGGLAVLFLMPVALITIMAWVQHAPFRDYQETNIPLLLVNNDQDTLGTVIEKGLQRSNIFQLQQSPDGEPISAKMARDKVSDGTYPIGIIIPEGATAALDSNARHILRSALSDMGLKPKTDDRKNPIGIVEVEILLDPATKKSFQNTLVSAMEKYVAKIEQRFLLQALSGELASLIPQLEDQGELDIEQLELVRFKQTYASSKKEVADLEANSVQHNVPAWTLFGMFFIVIPLAGSMIKERDDGSVQRLQTMPVPFVTVLGGKIGLYLLVCMLQFALMIAVGFGLLPQLGLPMLEVSGSWLALVSIALVAALAAVGYGIMVGTLFRTHAQATTFGSVSVVILASIGGIWVPMYVMPDTLQTLGLISPLGWGMSAFNDIFLRGSSSWQVLPEAMSLLLFFLATLIVALAYQKVTTRM
ncbi:MAG: ABC transporter permease [Bacteroidetes bacterium SW_11_45_7]|nr:MAG: ABC transporter permease [Bacteroidetes bacterium SW_11_45_7]